MHDEAKSAAALAMSGSVLMLMFFSARMILASLRKHSRPDSAGPSCSIKLWINAQSDGGPFDVSASDFNCPPKGMLITSGFGLGSVTQEIGRASCRERG